MESWLDKIIVGDCLDVLKEFPADSIDLIVTSPPYADSRKKTYGGPSPDEYVKWFLPRAAEFKRVLKPTGSFVLNIKEKAINGERHTYVLQLILKMKSIGWLWVEEYIWCKKNCTPGKWPNRFRDSWERCLHFTKQKKFSMYQEEVMVPMGDWAKSRLMKKDEDGNLIKKTVEEMGENDQIRYNSEVKSGFGKRVANWLDRDLAYPTNVLHLATECGNKKHSAAFPEALPSWFIRLFTREGDVILDPFIGSGTTALAASKLGRHFIGIDMSDEYVAFASNLITGHLLGEKEE
jgi:DNA modification methylase